MSFKLQNLYKIFISPIYGIAILSIIWLLLIGSLHYEFNVKKPNIRTIKMGYMPVITNLSAPILDHISKNRSDIRFEALKFASFADMAEAFKLNEIQAAFIIAPLSIVLYDKGIKLKVVYIGNRHESTLVVSKNARINDVQDLRGKKIAIPMRYSGHNLFLSKLAYEHNIDPHSIDIVEMQPPDMASALLTGDLDGYCVGEPFAAQTLVKGQADLLYHVEEKWPGFICNLVVLKEDFIVKEPSIAKPFIQALVRAGIWAGNNLEEAIQIASDYWNLHPDIVKYAFMTPKNRIRFDMYVPKTSEMQEIADLMYYNNLLDSPIQVDSFVDSTFTSKTDTTNILLNTIFSNSTFAF